MACDVATALSIVGNVPDIMVMGGGEIYKLFMPYATRLELTEVATEAEGDVKFPRYREQFQEIARVRVDGSPAFDYVTYVRR